MLTSYLIRGGPHDGGTMTVEAQADVYYLASRPLFDDGVVDRCWYGPQPHPTALYVPCASGRLEFRGIVAGTKERRA